MMIPTIMNLAIFITTLIIVIFFFRKDGRWNKERGLWALRFFTTISNIVCAIASLAVVIFSREGALPPSVWLFKYVGTSMVAVTMLTVLVFLGPTQGYRELFIKENLYMHLIGPLLAIISFCHFERGKMSIPVSLTGVIPVVIYGLIYLYRIKYAPKEKRWDDFYGFDANGKWQRSFAAMVAGSAVISLILRVIL